MSKQHFLRVSMAPQVYQSRRAHRPAPGPAQGQAAAIACDASKKRAGQQPVCSPGVAAQHARQLAELSYCHAEENKALLEASGVFASASGAR